MAGVLGATGGISGCPVGGGWEDRGGAGKCGSWNVLGGGPGDVLEGRVLGRSMGEIHKDSTGWSWGESWGMLGVPGGVVKGDWESCECPGQMLTDVWPRGSGWIPSVCA